VKKLINSKITCCLAISLILTILSSMVLVVAAQTSFSKPGIESWQPPTNFVDPVTLKIKEFRSQGLTDDQITVKLADLGMGWYPETGATWMGRSLTSEELANMPPTVPAQAPPSINPTGDGSEFSPLTQVGKTACMRTSSASWTGVSGEIVSGSMSNGNQQTVTVYVCMQLGNLDAASNWVETVLTHNYGDTYKWTTYDNDEGGLTFYMNKNTATTYADTYVIMLDGTNDGNGWKYDVWINYNWVRSGHLANLYVQAGFQKEVYSNTGTFTNDASRTIYYKDWLHNASGWSYWTNSVNTWWSTASPMRENHTYTGLCYDWEAWVQN
jgi:hypothetical protein